LTVLALIAVEAPIGGASAQEIMLERVGAVRMAPPGELERNGDWLAKAFRNQARLHGYDPKSIRVSASTHASEGMLPPR
jgi:hypothetical protein